MKKMILAMLGVLLTTTPALAEHKLLVTDVLDAKQLEGEATFEYTHLGGNLSSAAEGSGKTTANATESAYSLGVGLGHGLEMTASIPYLFREHARTRLGSEAEVENRDGIGDFALEGKYLLLGGEEERYAVVTGLGLKFDTASTHEGGTGTTDVSPFIAASTRLDHHYTPYAIYRATLRNHDAADTHTLSVGVEKELNHTFTLDGKIDANFNTATRDVSAYEDFSFELTGYVQVAHNFYLLPSVAYLVATDADYRGTDVHQSSLDGFRGGISLYYLF